MKKLLLFFLIIHNFASAQDFRVHLTIGANIVNTRLHHYNHSQKSAYFDNFIGPYIGLKFTQKINRFFDFRSGLAITARGVNPNNKVKTPLADTERTLVPTLHSEWLSTVLVSSDIPLEISLKIKRKFYILGGASIQFFQRRHDELPSLSAGIDIPLHLGAGFTHKRSGFEVCRYFGTIPYMTIYKPQDKFTDTYTYTNNQFIVVFNYCINQKVKGCKGCNDIR